MKFTGLALGHLVRRIYSSRGQWYLCWAGGSIIRCVTHCGWGCPQGPSQWSVGRGGSSVVEASLACWEHSAPLCVWPAGLPSGARVHLAHGAGGGAEHTELTFIQEKQSGCSTKAPTEEGSNSLTTVYSTDWFLESNQPCIPRMSHLAVV